MFELKRVEGGVSNTVWLASDGEWKYGLFYNSYDRKEHVWKYIPYKSIPHKALCEGINMVINCSPVGVEKNVCEDCLRLLNELKN